MRIALTPGEPAGIGPDVVIGLAQHSHSAQLVAIADPNLLEQRAKQLTLPLQLHNFEPKQTVYSSKAGELWVIKQSLHTPCQPGLLNPANAPYVLATLDCAVKGCLQGHWDALVTGPVQKSVLNDAGIAFSGHTEWLAHATGAPQAVMMLANHDLRVALATTHLPLRKVPEQITQDRLSRVLHILDHDLKNRFSIAQPRIAVLGLNPHAGENGSLGTEENDIIIPCLKQLRSKGLDLIGPLPADTAFTPKHLAGIDAVLAMYHDQGLPVLKSQGFGQAVNITLGLPIIRTSVDHGTALDLAGTGRADHNSLEQALNTAVAMATQKIEKT